VCIRPERVLVEAPVADAFLELCRGELGRLRQGPDDGGADQARIDVGAMTTPAQVEHVERQIREALAGGARLVAGGKRRTDLPGRFFEPTLLADVTPEMAVAREESFGPVMAIVRVRDAEQAVEVSNRFGLGLSGSVWSRDADKAAALARRLHAGSVCVNDVLMNYFCVESPLGGVKGSGLGLRHGAESLRQFCWTETVVEDAAILGAVSGYVARQLYFPYQTRVLKLLRWAMRRLYG
jgi:acyl-CoA reductase-like NAD-dependent aldehyde dehydrogenase